MSSCSPSVDRLGEARAAQIGMWCERGLACEQQRGPRRLDGRTIEIATRCESTTARQVGSAAVTDAMRHTYLVGAAAAAAAAAGAAFSFLAFGAGLSPVAAAATGAPAAAAATGAAGCPSAPAGAAPSLRL